MARESRGGQHRPLDGQLALSTWQNVFLCDFDGPRAERRVLVTITGE